ncbi:S-adenosyl-L-methionine-dependent methyltransferase [Peniophora sp. CONT]|nr:S-adenosyl-L-methionine-dependent methyltransferase [Peniophora sp. CONT]
MPGDPSTKSPGATTTAYGIERSEGEWARLKAQNHGIQAYLGGKLTPLPAAALGAPQRILDLGTGAGAWAVQAATEYPDAEITAVDMLPLPQSFTSLANFKFVQVDITQDLPFEEASFDIIHARFLLMHLPTPEAHITRILRLLVPGGHLITTEWDLRGDYAHNTPILVAAAKRLEAKMEAKGLVPHFASRIGGVLRATQAFAEITVKVVALPFNAAVVSDPAVRALTETMRDSMITIMPYWQGGLVDPEEHDAFLREVSQSGKDWYCEHDMVFTCSRKKL